MCSQHTRKSYQVVSRNEKLTSCCRRTAIIRLLGYEAHPSIPKHGSMEMSRHFSLRQEAQDRNLSVPDYIRFTAHPRQHVLVSLYMSLCHTLRTLCTPQTVQLRATKTSSSLLLQTHRLVPRQMRHHSHYSERSCWDHRPFLQPPASSTLENCRRS